MGVEDRRRALAEAETRVELERAALRQQRAVNRRAVREIQPWATVVGGLVAGWWLGRGRSSRSVSERYHERTQVESAHSRPGAQYSNARVPHSHAGDGRASDLPTPRRPTLLGLASLALAGSRAVPIVLPLALAWIDRRYGGDATRADAPPPVPMWVIALRGLAPLLRR